MLVEFAGGFDSFNPNKLTKMCRNTERHPNSKNSTSHHQPRNFNVPSYNYEIYFECIILVINRVHVGTRKTVMGIPYSLNRLKVSMKQFPGVFALCNAVISSVEEKVPPNNANLEIVLVPEIPRFHSLHIFYK